MIIWDRQTTQQTDKRTEEKTIGETASYFFRDTMIIMSNHVRLRSGPCNFVVASEFVFLSVLLPLLLSYFFLQNLCSFARFLVFITNSYTVSVSVCPTSCDIKIVCCSPSAPFVQPSLSLPLSCSPAWSFNVRAFLLKDTDVFWHADLKDIQPTSLFF